MGYGHNNRRGSLSRARFGRFPGEEIPEPVSETSPFLSGPLRVPMDLVHLERTCWALLVTATFHFHLTLYGASTVRMIHREHLFLHVHVGMFHLIYIEPLALLGIL